MDPLLQIVKTEILARETLDGKAFSDNPILKAIELYNQERSTSKKAQFFFEALTPLWKMHSKESYVEIFKNYIRMETGLETYTSDYSSHLSHVIHEFLFGYCIIMNSTSIKEKYGFEEGKNNPDSKFGELFFSWMAASLFHDIGYDIEKAPEEEEFREFQNDFWDFMSQRAITSVPLQLRVGGHGSQLIEDYIYKNIQPYFSEPLSYPQFEKLFFNKTKRPGWIRYDHGIISAVKYLSELSKLEEKTGTQNYLSWLPNIHAALAMALHNFRFKNCNLKISSSDPITFIPYLLITCDEIQAWNRERDDESKLDMKANEGKKSRKNIELLGLIFREKYAFVSINHRLKIPKYRDIFEEYFAGKIADLKRDYPIQILIPTPEFERILNFYLLYNYSNDLCKINYEKIDQLDSNFFQDLNNLKIEKNFQRNISTKKDKNILKISQIETKKQLLVRSEPSMYKIFVDHRIDGIPYLTVIFQI